MLSQKSVDDVLSPAGRELLVVYNADSGYFHAVFSSVHKFVSPETYECELCRVSHGLTGMLGSWKAYLGALSLPVRFYHRDQFKAVFAEADDLPLPAILLREPDGAMVSLLAAEAIGRAGNLVTLINLTDCALQEIDDEA